MENLDRSRRVLEIARAALDLPPAARRARVEEACGADAALHESVLALLESVLDDATLTIPPPSEPAEITAGIVVGGFVIRERIGEGAFGEVFLADRHEPFAQRVALKILKHGMGSREILARFALERDALARMDHPNVARVITGGRTADGRPWFAMEYVPGDPITKHCDDARLTLRDRVERVAEVCDGVAHAHQKGTIHRDIKPGNILVRWREGPAVAKVIDFGVAKLLDRTRSDGTLTDLRRLVGTPAYMAPEQWGDTAADVNTRTDVYALGVVLFELLTGVLPFDAKDVSLDTLRSAILKADPPRMSRRFAALPSVERQRIAQLRRTTPEALQSALASELDWIVRRCLDKDRGRRYAGAAALGSDLRRYLAGEALDAAPPSASYRLRKLVARHRWAVSVAAIVTVLSLTSAVFGIRAYRLARNVRHERAQAEVADARLLAFRYPAQALATLGEARRRAPDLPTINVAEAYVLSLDGKPDEARAKAEAVLRKAPDNAEGTAILAGLLRDSEPTRAAELEARARALLPREQLHLLALGIRDDGEAVARLSESLASFPWNFDALFQRAVRRFSLGDYRGAADDADVLLKVRPDLDLVWNLAGATALAAGDPARALERYDRALQLRPPRALKLVNRSLAYMQVGRNDEAWRDVEAARALDPGDREAMRQQCELHFRFQRWQESADCFARARAGQECALDLLRGSASARRMAGRFDEAIADYTEAIRCAGSRSAPELPQLHDLRGELERYAGRPEQAFADARRAFELDGSRAEASSNAGWSLLFAGRPAEARDWLDRAVNLSEPGLPATFEWRMRRAYGSFLHESGRAAASEFGAIAALPGWEFIGVFAWEAQLRAGRVQAAQRVVESLAARIAPQPGSAPTFNAAALGHLRGTTSEESLLDAAQSDADRLGAAYVIGARAAAQGRWDAARAQFERCAQSPPPLGLEVELCRLRLAAGR